jgi:APA family basic amino acid/polyamine antiporter
MFPRAGGQYVFLREAFHPLIAFLFGWTLIFAIQTGSIAAVAVAFARFAGKFYAMTDLTLSIVASVIIVVLSFINFLGIKRGAQFLDSITSFKIVAIVLFILGAIFLAPDRVVDAAGTATGAADWSLGEFVPSAFLIAMVSAFWAFDGWYSLTFVAGEVKDPAKNIPRASLIGIAVVTVLYIAVNLAYFQVLTVDEIKNSNFVAADAAEKLFGPIGVKVMGVLVILSVLGCLNSMIISGARVVYAMARDRVLPHQLSIVHPKTHSPNRALTLQMIWSVLLVWSGKYDNLYTYVIFAGFIFYGLTAFAVIFLRKEKGRNLERPYKVPFYPVLPWAYVLFCMWFVVNTLQESTAGEGEISGPIKGLVIVLSGVPVYYIMRRLTKTLES